MVSPPFFSFGGVFQDAKLLIPETFKKAAQVFKSFWTGPIETPCPLAAHSDKPNLSEQHQML